jgi:hypothetical protein
MCFFDDEPSPKIEQASQNVKLKGDWFGELEELTKDRWRVTVQALATLARGGQGNPKSLLMGNTQWTLGGSGAVRIDHRNGQRVQRMRVCSRSKNLLAGKAKMVGCKGHIAHP